MKKLIKDYCKLVSDSFANTANMKLDFENNEIENKGKQIIQKYLPLEFLFFKRFTEDEIIELVTSKIFQYENGYYYNYETGMYFDEKKLIVKKTTMKKPDAFILSDFYKDVYARKTALCFEKIVELKEEDEKYLGKIQSLLLTKNSTYNKGE